MRFLKCLLFNLLIGVSRCKRRAYLLRCDFSLTLYRCIGWNGGRSELPTYACSDLLLLTNHSQPVMTLNDLFFCCCRNAPDLESIDLLVYKPLVPKCQLTPLIQQPIELAPFGVTHRDCVGNVIAEFQP